MGDSLETALHLYREDIQRLRSEEHQQQLGALPAAALVLNGICERLAPMYHLFENAEELIANPMMPLVGALALLPPVRPLVRAKTAPARTP